MVFGKKKVTHDGMVVDKKTINTVMDMAKPKVDGLSEPKAPIDDLGKLKTADGKERNVILRHAVDPIVMDKQGRILVVRRGQFNPGKNKIALPGGFIDPDPAKGKDSMENLAKATARELREETGVDIPEEGFEKLGNWRTGRPFDVRHWEGPDSQVGDVTITYGDIVNVTTQGLVTIVDDLSEFELQAEDENEIKGVFAVDAEKLISGELAKELNDPDFVLGIEDHADMVKEGIQKLRQNLREANKPEQAQGEDTGRRQMTAKEYYGLGE